MKYLLAFLLILAGCQSASETPVLRVAAASSLNLPLTEIAQNFEAQNKVKVELVFASSGKICAQIEHGAPYDLFISANQEFTQRLQKANLVEGEPEVIALGQLILWSGKPGFLPGLEDLTSPEVHKIALPNPELAPFGQGARDFLQRQGLWDTLQPRLVLGESVSQTNQFLVSQAADCGFTSRSFIASKEFQENPHFTEINPNLHTPIAMTLVEVARQKDNADWPKKFRAFLNSDPCRQILKQNGFAPPLTHE
ncbi:MAG: molybdate ABC transporter substrate-binding protein [Bacteroidia bacterium]|nr:molybdate ABC transporter substrate-binding protein [Bacteroidia bacterium]